MLSAVERRVDKILHSSYSGSVILKIVYGYTMQETIDDPYLQLVLKAGEGVIAAANHGSFWVDYFPFLKYVPSESCCGNRGRESRADDGPY